VTRRIRPVPVCVLMRQAPAWSVLQPPMPAQCGDDSWWPLLCSATTPPSKGGGTAVPIPRTLSQTLADVPASAGIGYFGLDQPGLATVRRELPIPAEDRSPGVVQRLLCPTIRIQ
jgi:hypothetical protein